MTPDELAHQVAARLPADDRQQTAAVLRYDRDRRRNNGLPPPGPFLTALARALTGPPSVRTRTLTGPIAEPPPMLPVGEALLWLSERGARVTERTVRRWAAGARSPADAARTGRDWQLSESYLNHKMTQHKNRERTPR